MLLNNLDAEVAERPEELVVYGGSGQGGALARGAEGARPTLLELGDDETLLVQSGKPVGVFRTHPGAPRVLIANSLLVPRWANWDEFRRLEALGLTMFGQMTAGSWIYIGTQGILQGTYQTFAAAGETHFGSADLARAHDPDGRARRDGRRAAARRRRWRGRRFSASRSIRRGSSGGCRRAISTRRPTRSTTRSRASGPRPRKAARCRSGCSATPPRSCPSSRDAESTFDLVTDQTAAHDPLTGYVPVGLDVDEAAALRASDPDEYLAARTCVDCATRRRAARVRRAAAATFSIMATTFAGRPMKAA